MSSSRAASLRQALSERVVVADGAMGTMLQAVDLTLDDFQGHEGCNEILNVSRPDVVRRGARRLLRGRRGLRGDQHLRRQPRGPRRVRHRGPDLRARRGRRPASPASRRRLRDRRTGRAGCSARSGRGTKLPTLGHMPFATAARRLPGAGRRHDRRRRGRACWWRPARTCCRPRPRSSAPARAMARRPGRPAAVRPGHRRDHRHDAARLRDRRGADRARAARHRPDRAELRDRPGRDERAPAPPGQAAPGSACPACRTPACRCSTKDGALLPADPGGARRRARQLHRATTA